MKQAESVVEDVYRVLGRARGLRIGEESDRDGQYFHYLTKWMYALGQLGKYDLLSLLLAIEWKIISVCDVFELEV